MVGRAGTPTIQYSVNTQRMMTPWTWQQSITYYMCPPQEITKIGLFCLACAGTGHTTGECAMKAVSVNPSLPWPHMKHRQSTQPLLPASIRTEVAARGKISPCMCYQFRQPQTHSVLRNHKPIVCSMLFFQKGTQQHPANTHPGSGVTLQTDSPSHQSCLLLLPSSVITSYHHLVLPCSFLINQYHHAFISNWGHTRYIIADNAITCCLIYFAISTTKGLSSRVAARGHATPIAPIG